MKLFESFPDIETLKKLAKRRKRKIFLVGGFLRDYFVDRKNGDFDFAVDKNALSLAEKFAEEIKGAYVLLDEERGCARVVKKRKGQLLSFDFADFRADTIEEDLKLRDFTINMLALDLFSYDENIEFAKQIFDTKRAMKDLQAGRIKRISIRSLRDDPLRMLRAFSLQAMLGFRIELSTLNQIRKEREALQKVSPERIREEFFKILESDRSSKTIKSMNRIMFLECIIPQVRIMFDCQQGTYHHLDVWKHSLETVAQTERLIRQQKKNEDISAYLDEIIGGNHSRKAILKLGALLHDIGKPETKRKEGNHMSFHGHEHVGKNIVREVARMLKLSTAERHALEDMVQWHLRPGYLSNFKTPSDRSIFRYLRDTKEEGASILLLSLADQRSTRGPATTEEDQRHHEIICLSLVEKFFEKRKEVPFVRLIDGNDLIKELKLKPSPIFKEYLNGVEEEQRLGSITTRKEALDYVATKCSQTSNEKTK